MSDFIRRLPTHGISKYLTSVARIDGIFMFLVLCIQAIGLLSLYSATSGNTEKLIKQILFMGIGWVVIVGIARTPMVFIRYITPYLYAAMTILLILVHIVGVTINHSQRWIDVGLFSIQPSELLKVIVPLMVAFYLCRREHYISLKYAFISSLIIAFPCMFILSQPDLGTTIMVGMAGIIVLFLSGISKSYISSCIALTLISLPLIWRFGLYDYQRQRIFTLINPETDKFGAGWNIIQSKAAIGSGGFYGKGWIEGTQSQLEFLPETSTDFIASSIAEEWGFIGIMILMFLYGFMIFYIMLVALKTKNHFSSLVCASLGTILAASILINLSMVAGLMPIVGVPLPLISYGGSSIITISIIIGLIVRIRWENS